MTGRIQRCISVLLIALMFLLTGCGSNKLAAQNAKEGRTYVYCTDTRGEKLQALEYTAVHSSYSEVINEYLTEMRKVGRTEGCVSVLPEGLMLRGHTYEAGLLTLDFNAVYKQMNDVQEAAARSAIVLTMLQLPEVEQVLITVDGSKHENSRKHVIEAMGRQDVLLDWKVITE